MEPVDLFIFSHENILLQLQQAEFRNGFYVLRFYADNHLPVPYKTSTIEEFYLYPHGGTLRDKDYNLIFYDSRYDLYRGFSTPHFPTLKKQRTNNGT